MRSSLRVGLAALALAACANNHVTPRDGDGGRADAAAPALDAGEEPARDAGPGTLDASADAGPPRACTEGCGVLERCVEGLCAPYPACAGDGSCPDDAVCQRRMCLPRGVDLDGDGRAPPDDCFEGDPAIFPGATETCNGLDDDCDGMLDEALSRTCSTACGTGTETCAAGAWGGCTARAPTAETCNGMDDDCDGRTDEDLARACSTACGAGTETCAAGSFGACSARTPSAETCNGVDDDCDGMVDELLTRPCSTACGAGSETCSAGAWGGCTAPPVGVETCNLVDDDCNGTCDDASAGCRVPVHRSYHAGRDEHFYTTSRTEAACCGFSVELYDFYHLYRSAAPGLVAFYRCLLSSGYHFYTASATCEGSPGAIVEGTMGYLAPSPTCGSTPLYRLVRGNNHFYTTSAPERDHAIGLGYTSEGIAGHVWTRP